MRSQEKASSKRADRIADIPFRRKFRAWAERFQDCMGTLTCTGSGYQFSNLSKALTFYVGPQSILVSVVLGRHG